MIRDSEIDDLLICMLASSMFIATDSLICWFDDSSVSQSGSVDSYSLYVLGLRTFSTPGGSGMSWNRINPTNTIIGIVSGVFMKPKRLTNRD